MTRGCRADCYLRWWGYVFIDVCSFVSTIAGKLCNRLSQNSVESWHMVHGKPSDFDDNPCYVTRFRVRLELRLIGCHVRHDALRHCVVYRRSFNIFFRIIGLGECRRCTDWHSISSWWCGQLRMLVYVHVKCDVCVCVCVCVCVFVCVCVSMCVWLWQGDDVDEPVREAVKLVKRHQAVVDHRPPEDDNNDK